jgi:glutamyl-tRNA synthetase
MVEGILQSLRWLGLDWDEGPMVGGPYAPYFQSGRLDRHRALAERLVAQGSAYYCYCTPDELQDRRAAAGLSGDAWRYDRTCCALTPGQVAERERVGKPRAIRFKVPEGRMSFDDLVHGAIEFDGAYLEDFVILRSDGHPTYQLSVVADDVDMAITHVVRGDDHISNTPKQIHLYRAAGAPVPQFAHVPLILGPDKKRLSKRHGATSVAEYERRGYVPEAMVNFLALLGWSPGRGSSGVAGGPGGTPGGSGELKNQEVFSRDELVRAFSLDGISGGNAVFDPEKLEWFNQQHIMRLAPDELARRIRPLLESAGLWQQEYLGDRHAWFFSVLELLAPRAKRLDDFVARGRFFFTDAIEYDAAAVNKYLRVEGMDDHLAAVGAAWQDLPTFDPASTEVALRATAAARSVKAAAMIHAVRVAVTGSSVSPGLFEVLALLGRQRVQFRLEAAGRLLSSGNG